MRPEVLLRLAVRGEPDVFFLRQRGREVAAAVGLDQQDQSRVATVLSDRPTAAAVSSTVRPA